MIQKPLQGPRQLKGPTERRLGFPWATCIPNFRTCLYMSATGERAAAFKGLRPVREAGHGGWDLQETLLQGGGEKGVGPPHAALPGPLLRCSPGETRPPLCVPACGDPWSQREKVGGVCGLSPARALGRGRPRRPTDPLTEASLRCGEHVTVVFSPSRCLQASSAQPPFPSSTFYGLPSSPLGAMTWSWFKLSFSTSSVAPGGAGLFWGCWG